MTKSMYDLIKEVSKLIKTTGLTIEIGSAIFNSRYNLRNIFTGEYIGIDMNPGDGVDMVSNAHDLNYNGKTADVVICSSVFEHDDNPLKTVESIKRISHENTVCIFTVPFNWPIHGYPCDYWRMTPDGLRVLLKTQFDNIQVFGIGEKLIPHTTIGLVNTELPESVISRLNKRWIDDSGRFYYYMKNLLHPFIIKLIKYIMHGRFV